MANNMRKLCNKYLARTAELYPNSTRVAICENYGLRMIIPVSQYHVCYNNEYLNIHVFCPSIIILTSFISHIANKMSIVSL